MVDLLAGVNSPPQCEPGRVLTVGIASWTGNLYNNGVSIVPLVVTPCAMLHYPVAILGLGVYPLPVGKVEFDFRRSRWKGSATPPREHSVRAVPIGH
jgi:hypothetical protein